jgi:hypothetical protein
MQKTNFSKLVLVRVNQCPNIKLKMSNPTLYTELKINKRGQWIHVLESKNQEPYPERSPEEEPTRVVYSIVIGGKVFRVEYPRNEATNRWGRDEVFGDIRRAINNIKTKLLIIAEKYKYKQNGQWVSVTRTPSHKSSDDNYYRYSQKVKGRFFLVEFKKNEVTNGWLDNWKRDKEDENNRGGMKNLIYMNILHKLEDLNETSRNRNEVIPGGREDEDVQEEPEDVQEEPEDVQEEPEGVQREPIRENENVQEPIRENVQEPIRENENVRSELINRVIHERDGELRLLLFYILCVLVYRNYF